MFRLCFSWVNTQVDVDIEEWDKADTPKKKENDLKKKGITELLET